MITGERTITVKFSIFSKTLDQMNQKHEQLRKEMYDILKRHEKLNTDEVQIHPLAPDRCPNCNELWPICKCGKPNRSPAV